MRKLFVAFALLACTILTSCVDKTPLSEENKIYSGKWVTNDGTWLQVYNDGGGDFEMSNSSVTGGATVITDSTLEIGLMGLTNSFSIDKPPFEEAGELKMVLDGNTYIRQ